MSTINIGWFTTAPHPYKKAHRHGADDGQVGWRLHVVPVDARGEPEKRAQALCGLRPKHGWGMDLFIEDECSRCSAVMAKREATGDVFIDLPEVRREARTKAFNEGCNASYRRQGRSTNPYSDTPYLHAEWLRGFDEEERTQISD